MLHQDLQVNSQNRQAYKSWHKTPEHNNPPAVQLKIKKIALRASIKHHAADDINVKESKIVCTEINGVDSMDYRDFKRFK